MIEGHRFSGEGLFCSVPSCGRGRSDHIVSRYDDAPKPRPDLEAAFLEFHSENPHVLDRLETLALEAYRRGKRRWSIAAIYEVARWEHFRTTGDEWKLNNNFKPLYARLIMKRNPRLAACEFFELRGDE